MAISYTDQYYAFDPADPPFFGEDVTPLTGSFVDQNENGVLARGGADSVNGFDIRRVWLNDTVTIDVPGEGEITYTGVTFYLAGGGRVFTPTDGQVLKAGTFVDSTASPNAGSVDPDDLGPVCFVKGTLIDTPAGPRPIETLTAGDLVITRDHGPQPLVMVARKTMTAEALQAKPRSAPVHVAPGALGPGLPERDLYLSPQHRVLLRSPIVQRMYDTPEVLAPVAQLTALPGITRTEDLSGVTYLHLVLADHQIVSAHGLPAETLFFGPYVEDVFTRAELCALAQACGPHRPDTPARDLVKGPKLKNLVQRHLKNDMPLLQPTPTGGDQSAA